MRRWAGLLSSICVSGVAVLHATGRASLTEGLPMMVIALLFVAAGFVALTRRPEDVGGLLLVLAGLAWLLSAALTSTTSRVGFSVGVSLFALGLAPLAHLAIAFPGGRLATRLERVLVGATYGIAAASLPVGGRATCGDCPVLPLGLDVERGVGRVWYGTLLVAVLAVTAGVLVVLVRRWHRATPAARRVLLPVIPGACLFAAVYLVAILSELGVPTGLGQLWAPLALAVVAAAPLGYLGGVLRSRLARKGVSRLVVELGEAAPADGLRDTLAATLGDPDLRLAYWDPERGRYVDPGGSPVTVPVEEPGRSAAVIERNGRRVGAIVYDSALSDDARLVDAVATAAGMVMENRGLHAELQARFEEVRTSRARIVEAADAARRRVERDLHDGTQQRLVALKLAAGMARTRLGPAPDPALDSLLQEISDEARLALRDLRELARGLHPTLLREAGLEAALDSLAERSAVPVDLAFRVVGALPDAVAATAYFVVSEALTNVAKHAQATAVHVRVDQVADRLHVEVVDDGVGGAEARPGSGLEGLADRAAALGGQLEVTGVDGHGTRIRVELPCE